MVKPEFRDWEIVFTKSGFKRMESVRMYCVKDWWIFLFFAIHIALIFVVTVRILDSC